MYQKELSAINKRFNALVQERASWVPHWREVSDYVDQRRGRYLSSNRNKGDKINGKIINPAAKKHLDIAKAGLMSGITSPFRPWFELGLVDKDKQSFRTIKDWLDCSTLVLRNILVRSNMYTAFPQIYDEMLRFGQGPLLINEDYQDVIRGHVFTAGEYVIGQDEYGRINKFGREFDITIENLINWFGKQNVSKTVLNAFEAGRCEDYITIKHFILPNDGKVDLGRANDRPFASYYYEAANNEDKFLEARGYEEFPVSCPRWDICTGDVYARSPSMDALPDSKQLQKMERVKHKGIDKWASPTMNASSGLMGKRTSSLPDDVVFLEPNEQYAPAYSINPNITPLVEEIARVEDRIARHYFADLFLMLSQSDRRQITAREIEERHEEKLLMLGPVYQRLNDEGLDPLIKRIFNIADRNGLIPPRPEEMEGEDLKIEYTSIMAQAMQSVVTQRVEALYTFAGNIAGVYPQIRHRLNVDETIKIYADALGVPANVLNSDEQYKQLIEAEQQAMAQQQQGAEIGQSVEAARLLSETNTGGGSNALMDILGI